MAAQHGPQAHITHADRPLQPHAQLAAYHNRNHPNMLCDNHTQEPVKRQTIWVTFQHNRSLTETPPARRRSLTM
jgi:hypothetical protein